MIKQWNKQNTQDKIKYQEKDTLNKLRQIK